MLLVRFSKLQLLAPTKELISLHVTTIVSSRQRIQIISREIRIQFPEPFRPLSVALLFHSRQTHQVALPVQVFHFLSSQSKNWRESHLGQLRKLKERRHIRHDRLLRVHLRHPQSLEFREQFKPDRVFDNPDPERTLPDWLPVLACHADHRHHSADQLRGSSFKREFLRICLVQVDPSFKHVFWSQRRGASAWPSRQAKSPSGCKPLSGNMHRPSWG